MKYTIQDLIELTIKENASDIHLQVNAPPTLRVHGDMIPVEAPALTEAETHEFVKAVAQPNHISQATSKGDSDFGFTYKDGSRFRVSILKNQGNWGMVMRLIPSNSLSLEDIGIPECVREMLHRPRGLVLVTGPTGSGKTTTLAAMINYINKNRLGHIITIEDPIEFVYKHDNCIVTQKEVGTDVHSFASAVRGALRQDPDVIMVGELRDYETMKAALTAAETGHLVLGTLHTMGAARTVDRIINSFPEAAQEEARLELASVLVGAMSQTLVKSQEGGRVAAFEIMVMTDAISALIRENKSFRITSELQTGGRLGMITLDGHLQFLLKKGLITEQDALEKCQDTGMMKEFISSNVVA